MTKEHLGIALALKVPFFFVITKVDMVEKETIKKTLKQLITITKSHVVNKKPLVIQINEKMNQADIKTVHEHKDNETNQEGEIR